MSINNSNGFDNFDMVLFINLEHRKDRLIHITGELNKTNINKKKIYRIPGIYNKEFGALGCTKSHILALNFFLNSEHFKKFRNRKKISGMEIKKHTQIVVGSLFP